MIIFGIDPGLSATGYGAIETRGNRITPQLWGVIRSGNGSLTQRLNRIHTEVSGFLARTNPDLVAVEDIFLGKNPRSALLMGHARGVVLLAAAQKGLKVVEYPTAVIKKSIVGQGRASKVQVEYMVKRLLGLSDPKIPTDAADALAAALCCALRGERI